MIDKTNLVEFLAFLAAILGSIAAIIGGAIAIAKRLPILMDMVKKSTFFQLVLKAVVYFLFFLTLAVPNGLIVWFMIFQVAKSPRQILEPAVFFLVIVQITALVSIYSLVWGVWFVPRLRKSPQNGETPKG